MRVPHVWVENMDVLFGHVAVGWVIGWVNFIRIQPETTVMLIDVKVKDS
jgi:hypothetical protein